MDDGDNNTYTCMCGEVCNSKEELKDHNEAVHGDRMEEEVDEMEPDQKSESN